jgi:hypothetical protein
MMKLAKEHEHLKNFRRDLFFKLGFLLSKEYDVLILKDFEAQNLIQRGETKRRRLRLHDSSSQILGLCWSGSPRSVGEHYSPSQRTTHPANASSAGGQPEPEA